MQVKQFLIQFEHNESTRWLATDQRLADFIAACANEAARYHTDGAFPATTVYPIQGAHKIADGQQLAGVQLKEGVKR